MRAVVMATDWVGAIPALDLRLRSEPPALVADLACGAGWSAIGLARAYPHVTVRGWDGDDGMIALARRNASDADLGRRVAFELAHPSVDGRFDLVTASTPLDGTDEVDDLLRAARSLVVPTGEVVFVHAEPAEPLLARAGTAGFSGVEAITVDHSLFGVFRLLP